MVNIFGQKEEALFVLPIRVRASRTKCCAGNIRVQNSRIGFIYILDMCSYVDIIGGQFVFFERVQYMGDTGEESIQKNLQGEQKHGRLRSN